MAGARTTLQIGERTRSDAAASGERTAPHAGDGALERRLDEASPEQPVTLGKYVVLRRIGAGGMGVVYEARGPHGQRIALKTVRDAGSSWLYHLKNEFRAVAGLSHPNLVALYELVAEGDGAYFTMELVDGVSFVDHVCAPRDAAVTVGTRTSGVVSETRLYTATGGPEEVDGDAFHVPELAPSSIARLRGAVVQLVSGVSALHQAGKLHRDLKPSNVLVDGRGRVAVLDFGMAGDTLADAIGGGRVEGTPAYMAPEQAAGKPAVPASDWYAVGGILYRTLAGRPPFTGSVAHVLSAKQREPPPPPSAIAPSVPADLDALCVALLQTSPEDRPDAAEIMRRLGGTPPRAAHPPQSAPQAFAGRDHELEALLDAQAAVAPGLPLAVTVLAPSGMGKTALVQRFGASLQRTRGALVLWGRCHACESVPYKVFDGMIDALGRRLARLPPEERAALVPEDTADLALVFPVLREIVGAAPSRLPGDGGSPEARIGAFRALKEILRRLSLAGPVVLVADDLQWGDVDSAHLARELLSEPGAPGLLFVGTCRSEEVAVSPFLQELGRTGPAGWGSREISLGPLPEAVATHLALELLGGTRGEAEAEAIAAEAGGSPLFLEELVRDARAGRDGRSASEPRARSLDAVIQGRVARLPEEAQRLLAVVALAGVSLEQRVALAAAGIGERAAPSLHVLRAGNLIRTRGARDEDGIETYHDRVRESVTRTLAPEARRGLHLALGHALEAAGTAEPEVLARHFLSGGRRDKAHGHALRAAEQAASALAFDRAASLYALALELEDGGPEACRALTRKRADALVRGGRSVEAAPCYLACVAGAPPGEALHLRRCAAEQLLVGGRIDDGIAVLRAVLAAGEIAYPSTPGRAMAGMLLGFGRLVLRGTTFRERRPDEVPERDRLRVDLAMSAARGLVACDMTRGAYFTVEALLLALDAGDPRPIARALAGVGLMMVYDGSSQGVRRGMALIERGRRLALDLDDPALLASADIAVAIAHQTACRFRQAVAAVDPPVRALEELRAGYDHERSYGAMTAILALEYLGRLDEVSLRARQILRHAEATGNLYARVQATLYVALGSIARGEARHAAELVEGVMALWPSEGRSFLFQHWLALKTATYADLYDGDAAAALGRVTRQWPALQASGLLRLQFLTIFAHHLRAAASLAAARRGAMDRSRGIAAAEEDAARLSRAAKLPIAEGAAALVRAGAAALRRRPEAALGHLETAIQRYEAADMALHAAVARRRKGELTGGEAGRAMIAAADGAMASGGIANGERWAAMIAPGVD